MTISDEWWEKWWEEDYSWEGLAEKPWEGWYVDKAWVEGHPFESVPEDEQAEGIDYRDATLQDYWRRAQAEVGLSDEDFFVDLKAADARRADDGAVRFTIMHLPPKAKTGLETVKAYWKKPPDALQNLLRRELGRAMKETVFEYGWLVKGADHRLQWQGGVLPDFDLLGLSPQAQDQDKRTPISVIARRAAFSVYADFNSAAFSGYADFNDAAFSGNAGFRSAAFSGNANFRSAAFSGKADFMSVAFSGYANFRSAAFSGYADFNDAAFSGNADFESAAFSDYANFRSAAFSGDADFESTAFSGNADFESAAFSDYANFRSAAFSGFADFMSAAFSGFADFMSAAFLLDAVFSGKGNSVTSDAVTAEIRPKASDSSVQVFEQPEAITWTAQRSFPNVGFANAIFMGAALFDNRDFHTAASFDDARFFRQAEFHGSSLHRGILFTQTTFDMALTPAARNVEAAPKEALERLHKAAMLRVPDDEQQSLEAWAQARFEEILKYDDALKPEKDSDRSRYFERVEEGFRTLKHAMEDRRNRGQEARFFQLELRARRERRDEKFVPRWERIFSDVYKAASNFGTSVGLPLGWLALLTLILFPALYLFMGAGFTHWPTWGEFGDAMGYSFARILPFGPWEDPKTCSMTARMLAEGVQPDCPPVRGLEDLHYRGGTPFWLRFWGSVQSFTALVLVFLSGLAIRRRFQIN